MREFDRAEGRRAARSLASALAASLAAATLGASCGGSGGGGGGDGTGRLTLSVTDAAVDGASRVVVRFRDVELKPAEGDPITIGLGASRSVDLLALEGAASEALLEDVELPGGPYDWLRLGVEAERSTLDSFVELDDGSLVSLYVPSGSRSGLKLVSGFVVPLGGAASFTVDFDLRRSLVDPVGQPGELYLKPALRLIDDAEVGAIAGTVAASEVEGPGCTGTDAEPGAVYVYAGAPAVLDDLGGPGTQPLTSARIRPDEAAGALRYAVGFLAPGPYTVAVTCQAAGDDPERDDDLAFGARGVAEVVTGRTATLDLG